MLQEIIITDLVSGHMIYALLKKQNGGQYLKKLRQNLCTLQGKTTLHGFIFPGLDAKKDSSFLIQSDMITGLNLDLPSKSSIRQYDSGKWRFFSYPWVKSML